jgi:hypothetical protein
MPADEDARKQLWQLYHAQIAYRMKNGRYAANIAQLKLSGGRYKMQMEGISTQFTASILLDALKKKISIDQEGKILLEKL